MTLAELNQRVEEKLQEKHPAIVLGVFRHVLKKHNPKTAKDCQCEYCRLLPEYIAAKIYHHRIKSIVERDYEGHFPYNQCNVEYAKSQVNKLKQQKNSLKLI
jgi:hypothetical protein